MGLTIKINCTDCGHERVLVGINTNELPLDVLMLDTHSCECTKKCEECEDIKKCEDCEDMTLLCKLIKKNKRLTLQLKGIQLAHE